MGQNPIHWHSPRVQLPRGPDSKPVQIRSPAFQFLREERSRLGDHNPGLLGSTPRRATFRPRLMAGPQVLALRIGVRFPGPEYTQRYAGALRQLPHGGVHHACNRRLALALPVWEYTR